MPDYAPINTWRYLVRYQSGGLTHKVLLRTGEFAPLIVAADVYLAQAVDAIASLLPSDFAWLDAQQAPKGVNIFSPSALPAQPTGLSGGNERSYGANYFTFGYKSLDGVIGDFQIFGIQLGPAAVAGKNYRVSYGEDVNVDLALDVLQGQSDLTTISGEPAIFRPYVNYGVSAYWQRKLR